MPQIHDVVNLSTETIRGLADAFKPSWGEHAFQLFLGLVGALIGAGATVWATIKSLKDNLDAQRVEFERERKAKLTATWKGAYLEVVMIKTLLSEDGSKDWSAFVSVPSSFLDEVHPFLTICDEDLQRIVIDFILLVKKHNELIELARSSEMSQRNVVLPTILSLRGRVLLACDGVIQQTEAYLKSSLGV